MSECLLNIESPSMKDNLMLTGLPEADEKNGS